MDNAAPPNPKTSIVAATTTFLVLLKSTWLLINIFKPFTQINPYNNTEIPPNTGCGIAVKSAVKCPENAKMIAMEKANLTPIYCVGETLAQFEANETKEVVKEQVVKGLEGLSAEYVSKMIIAYEPVWSIGTGKNASKEIAQDVCHFIRKEVAKLYGRKVANRVIIQYGGSVKPHNVKEYLTQPDIDGALVGGASLKVESFVEMIENLIA